MSNILVIGSSNTDMIIKTERLPRPGETVGNGQFSIVNGGKGANQAVAAARAGGQVRFVTCLGDDLFGKQQLENFRDSGIATNFVQQLAGTPTGTALILVDAKGENSIAIAPGANGKMTPEHIEDAESAFIEADWLLLQLEIPLATVAHCLKKADETNTKVLLNPAPAQALSDDLLAKVHTLIVNETEAALLSGRSEVVTDAEIREVAQELLRKVGDTVILTLGAQGAYVTTKSGVRSYVAGRKVEVVDTTAAGDVFCGTLAVALSEGKSIREALAFSVAASALAVTKLGAQPSAPDRKAIETMIDG